MRDATNASFSLPDAGSKNRRPAVYGYLVDIILKVIPSKMVGYLQGNSWYISTENELRVPFGWRALTVWSDH